MLSNPVVTKLRRIFYLVSPNETSFQTINHVPNYVQEAIPYFLGLIILEFFVLVLQGKSLPRFNDGLNSISAGLLSLLHGLLFRSVELAAYIWVFERCCLTELPWDSPWTWLLAFLGVDFGYYWVHRASHEMSIFWASHQTHHSSEDYNLTTALRQSAFQKYVSWMFYLPMALFVPPSIFLVHNQFNLLYQFWIHTETIKSLGPLEYLLNTPSHHRVHHGRNPYCIDVNYGGTLIIWDRLLGTFQAEDDKEKVVYGLVSPLNSWDPIHAQVCYYRYLWQRLWTMEGAASKLWVLLKGPGWVPGSPWTGHKEDIPQVEHPATKYDRDLPLWTNLYVWLHFIVVVAAHTLLAAQAQQLPTVMVVLSILYIVFALYTFGALYDHKHTAPWLECFRCILGAGLVHLLTPTMTPLTFGLYLLHLSSALVWATKSFFHFSCSAKKVD